MRLLGRWPCVKVDEIRIVQHNSTHAPLLVWINDIPLVDDEANTLFLRDGFRDNGGETYTHIHQAAEFWKRQDFPFLGHLIHWDFTRPVVSSSSGTGFPPQETVHVS
jgi:hypothetical protein